MIIVDGVAHHTGTNIEDAEHTIPKSKFEVSATTRGGKEEFGEKKVYEAYDESDAIAQFNRDNEVRIATRGKRKGSSVISHKVKAVKESRKDILDPPEPVAEPVSKVPVRAASKKGSRK